MTSAAKAAAAVLRPALLRWRRYWAVDHRAPNFHSADPEALDEVLTQQQEAYDRALRTHAAGYARRDILPRLRFDLSQGLRGIRLEARHDAAAGLRGDLLSRNPVAFHLLLGVPAFLTVAAAWAFMHWFSLQSVSRGANPSLLVNRNVLSARLEVLEETLGQQAAVRATAPPSGAAASFDRGNRGSGSGDGDSGGWLQSLFSRPATVVTSNTMITEPFRRELSAIRKAKAEGVAALPPHSATDVRALEQLEARVDRLEAALQQRADTQPPGGGPGGALLPPSPAIAASLPRNGPPSATANSVVLPTPPPG